MFYNVSYMLNGNLKIAGVAANSESEAKAKAVKSLPKGADVYHVEKAPSEEKTRAYMKSKGMKIIDKAIIACDADKVIESMVQDFARKCEYAIKNANRLNQDSTFSELQATYKAADDAIIKALNELNNTRNKLHKDYSKYGRLVTEAFSKAEKW